MHSGKLLTLVCSVGEQRYLLPLTRVVEVSLRVEVRELPGAVEPVRGVVVWRSIPIPILNLAACLGTASNRPRIDDHFVVATVHELVVGIEIERALGVESVKQSQIMPTPAQSRIVPGMLALGDELGFLLELDEVLRIEQVRQLVPALDHFREGLNA